MVFYMPAAFNRFTFHVCFFRGQAVRCAVNLILQFIGKKNGKNDFISVEITNFAIAIAKLVKSLTVDFNKPAFHIFLNHMGSKTGSRSQNENVT